jgi:hypothetical protein
MTHEKARMMRAFSRLTTAGDIYADKVLPDILVAASTMM